MKRKSDIDILVQYHQFVLETKNNNDEQSAIKTEKIKDDQDYGQLIFKKYYDKLYKEFAIIQFTNYEKGQLGIRWRTQKEVLNGKGFKICCSKQCENDQQLFTYEVNFKYKEMDQYKNTLVKVKCCKECSVKLNYKSQHKQIFQQNIEKKIKM